MKNLTLILIFAVITSCSGQTSKNDPSMKQAEAITLPSILGEQSGKIIKWYVGEGDFVKEGQILADLEMGSATMELESYTSGTILYKGAKVDQDINVGYLIAIIGDQGADIDSIIRKSAKDYLETESERTSMKGYLGEVKMFAGKITPKNWRLCDGKELRVDDFPELYDVIKIKYGGDGNRNFNLPNIDPVNGVAYIICVKGDFPK